MEDLAVNGNSPIEAGPRLTPDASGGFLKPSQKSVDSKHFVIRTDLTVEQMLWSQGLVEFEYYELAEHFHPGPWRRTCEFGIHTFTMYCGEG